MLNILKDIGLTEKEIQIFEILLSHGELSIIKISKLTGVSRSYCYDALESLMKKGFVVKVVLNNKIAWKAAQTNRILDHIDSVKEEIRTKLKQTKPLEKKDELKINFYKGVNGIKLICDDVLNTKTKVIGWGAEGQLGKYMPHYYKHFKKTCKKRNIKADFIILKTMDPLAMVNVNAKKFPYVFNTNVEINIYDNKTLIFFWKDIPEAIEIVDEEVAKSFRGYHEIFWKKLR